MRVLLTLVALTQFEELLTLEYAAITVQQIHPANLKVGKKNLDFMNKIKQDLRRNNDDYALLEEQNQMYPSVLEHPAPRHPNRKRYSATNRLPPSDWVGLPQRYYIDARRGNGGVFQGDVNQGQVNLTTVFRRNTRARPVKKRLRTSKLKKMLRKDKYKLHARDESQGRTEMEVNMKIKYMMSSTLSTTVPNRAIPPTLAPLLPPSSPSPPSLLPPRPRLKHTPRPTLRVSGLSEEVVHQAPPRGSPLSEVPARQAHPRYSDLLHKMERQGPPRDSVLSEEQTVRQVLRSTQRIPAPLHDQIDMAHARNPILARIRMKGRLCQRSLMNIQGPMYNKEGKQVIPPHRPRLSHGRLFHETRAPDLVLPKCCNCCKKSVLGCQ